MNLWCWCTKDVAFAPACVFLSRLKRRRRFVESGHVMEARALLLFIIIWFSIQFDWHLRKKRRQMHHNVQTQCSELEFHSKTSFKVKTDLISHLRITAHNRTCMYTVSLTNPFLPHYGFSFVPITIPSNLLSPILPRSQNL